MTPLAVAGLAAIAVGLVLVLSGAVVAIGEVRHPREGTKGLPETLSALSQFADALARHPVGIRLVFLGVLLVILGGTMCGLSTLLE